MCCTGNFEAEPLVQAANLIVGGQDARALLLLMLLALLASSTTCVHMCNIYSCTGKHI